MLLIKSVGLLTTEKKCSPSVVSIAVWNQHKTKNKSEMQKLKTIIQTNVTDA